MKRNVSTAISAVSENMTSLYTSPVTFLVLYENWTEVKDRPVCLVGRQCLTVIYPFEYAADYYFFFKEMSV